MSIIKQISTYKLRKHVYIAVVTVLSVVIALFSANCYAQQLQGQTAVDLNISKSDIGYMVTSGYLYFFSSKLSLKGAAFYEHGSPYQFHYSNLGVQALLRYNLFNIDRIIYITPYVGPAINFDHITPVKPSYSSSLNYGAIVGTEVEAALTESFSFFTYYNQWALIKKPIGNERYDFGVGVRVYLGSDL